MAVTRIFFSRSFLAVPEPYRLSDEARQKYYEYLEKEHPINAGDDIVIPNPADAMKLAYGG